MAEKKEVAAITFHSAYNHGSVLQAYALQEFVKKELGKYFDYRIINLRTERQKKYYDKSFGLLDIKNNIKKIIFLNCISAIKKRKIKYEDFICSELNVTEEFADMDEIIKANLNFDYYISGSDQIWNYSILDFDWSFFLEFVNDNAKKISYAASFGPKELSLDDKEGMRLKEDLKNYDCISVREKGSADKVRQIIEDDIAKTHIDPTLLLDKKDWDGIAGERIIKNDYILLYDLKGKRVAYDISRNLSKKYNIPVIIVKENAKMHLLYRDFVKKYDAGPLEFLNYIKYAKIVVSSSFHGNVFSIIFERPFLAVEGKEDFRIGHMLKNMKLEYRAVSTIEDIPSADSLFKVDFSYAKKYISKERERSRKYLAQALDMEID